MKKNVIVKSIIILASICILIFLIWIYLFPNRSNKSNENIDKLISVNKLNTKTLIVSLGYDVVMAIETQKGIAVIDAGISNSLTAKYRKIIEREFKRHDFAYLINTHSHWDHTGGNQVFADAVIIAHENCVTEMSEYWKDKNKIKLNLQKIVNDYENKLKSFDPEWQDSLEIEKQIIRYQSAYNDLMTNRLVTFPTITFKDTMNLFMSDLSFHMIYFGRAHSGSDILIYVPELELLMTGDLFSEGGRAAFDVLEKKDIKQWMTAKKWIEKRKDNIETVVNGHGSILGKNDLAAFVKYINEMGTESKRVSSTGNVKM
ncbi:MAG: MBL fold metallo-hydrolase [Ignavibacteriaceae bacterium]|jgi:glyoxylase-like metal-dependent hydrolase (beta-lactamase superfamily II)|nr:MBL fold metallo-hydrolase [Ignavibacteriaceae bacterium]MCW8817830.1 MBL fold metallo-hydrolase [Ignavibacteriaceae bacterium]MCW9095443.1 MBL fold metallo-hydrolase [Ignavibacteriaceae bacterium]MCW9098095.1 MBL fold metallo-hydrolase [Ignavibacteriaceae bacterium]